MKNKVTYWALGILAVITISSAIYIGETQDTYASIEYMIVMLTFASLEVGVLLLIALVLDLQSRSEGAPKVELKSRSKRFLLAALIVVTVGFSVCFGGGMLFDQ